MTDEQHQNVTKASEALRYFDAARSLLPTGSLHPLMQTLTRIAEGKPDTLEPMEAQACVYAIWFTCEMSRAAEAQREQAEQTPARPTQPTDTTPETWADFRRR